MAKRKEQEPVVTNEAVSPRPWRWVQDCGNSITIFDADGTEIGTVGGPDCEEIGDTETDNAKIIVALVNKHAAEG